MKIAEALDLAKEIEPILKDHGPDVVGAALSQLTAIWVAGHPERVRAGLIEMHIVGVREMVEVILKERT